MFLLKPRRKYTRQPSRYYFPRHDSPEVGSYSEDAPLEGFQSIDAAQYEGIPRRCYMVRGLSLHTTAGRAFLASPQALATQPGFGGPPLVRVYNGESNVPCIPPAALRLLTMKWQQGSRCVDRKKGLYTLLRRAGDARDAAALVRFFSRPKVVQLLLLLCYLMGLRCGRRFCRALHLLES